MTDAAYLRARGWCELSADMWTRSNETSGRIRTLAEAVAEQLAQDRAVAEYVANRSAVTLITRHASPGTLPAVVDNQVAGVRLGPREK